MGAENSKAIEQEEWERQMKQQEEYQRQKRRVEEEEWDRKRRLETQEWEKQRREAHQQWERQQIEAEKKLSERQMREAEEQWERQRREAQQQWERQQIEAEKQELERQRRKAEQQAHQREQKARAEAESNLQRAQEELKQLKMKPTVLDIPFRKVSMDKENMDKLRDEVIKATSCCEEVPKLRALLLGLVGHGKTSFVNTIFSTIMGEVLPTSPVGSDTKSVTKQFRQHQFESAERKVDEHKKGRNKRKAEDFTNFLLCDTMGVEEEDGITEQDITCILDGHIKNEYKFNPGKAIDTRNTHYRRKPSLKHKIHCVGVCVDASKLKILKGDGLAKIKCIKSEITAKEISFIVILTKIDTVCQLTQENPEKTFYSPKVKDAVENAAQLFGVPVNQVFPVKNYEK